MAKKRLLVLNQSLTNTSDKCLPTRNVLQVSFTHIFISRTRFIGLLNSMRILYRLPSKLNYRLSWSLYIADALPNCIHIFSTVFDECIMCDKNIWISSRGQPTRSIPPNWGLGDLLTNPYLKKITVLRTIRNCLGALPGHFIDQMLPTSVHVRSWIDLRVLPI